MTHLNSFIFQMLLVSFSQWAIGQELTESSVTFNHLALSVIDADQSAEFYKKTLNLKEITNKTENNQIRWLSLGEGKELHLLSFPNDEIKVNRAVHLALTISDFDAFIKKLDAMKVNYSDWMGEIPNKINIRADGIKQVYFQDPNGYWIEVNSVGQKKD
jgi:lactoylglutathione lyase|tara:strand:- start:191 stop:667 length:477 start_codon:yes stop_codon:yes gene_type:complete